jgi:aminomethyltransferase
MEIMHDVSDGAIGSELRYFGAGFFPIGGQSVYVSRTGWTGELGYEIYSLGDATDHRKLWHDLFTAGVPHGMQLGSLNALGIRRIEAGILDAGSDFDSSVTPFQAGLGAFVDLDKPDFIGRSALIDADRHNLMYGLKCENTAPRRGDDVLEGDQVVGRVTAGASSPYLECGIGYVRFARAGDWLGRKLSLGGSDGGLVECEITGLPFYDAEKRIPRGG